MTAWTRRGGVALALALALAAVGCGEDSHTLPTSYEVDGGYNFAAAGAVAGSNRRDAGRGLLEGVLLDSSQRAVSGAMVTLYRLLEVTRQSNALTTVSATDGSYVFGNLEPGAYRVRVQNQQVDATVIADANTPANFSNVTPLSNGGGDNNGGTGNGGDNGGGNRFKWTMIIFMNADNDLEPYGIQDVNEMEALPDSDDVAIVVLMDRTRGYDSSNGNWTDTRRFRIRHDNDPALMTSALSPDEGGNAEVLGELDMGSHETLRQFINWAMTNYPADHYLVDMWNHGAGWRQRMSDPLLSRSRGVSYDDTQNTYITTPELSDGLAVNKPIDIVAFDSSLMQMLEVAYQIRTRCDFVVGSEESPPGPGYPYDVIFRPVIDNPNLTPEAFAASIVNNTIAELGGDYSLTQSALRSSRLGALGTAVSNYADLLQQKTPLFRSVIEAARTATQRYGSGSGLYEGNRDLIDFADQVYDRTRDNDLLAGRDALRAALADALVAEAHTGSNLSRSNGLAIFIPSQADWSVLRSRYLTQAFARDHRWDEWLDAFYGVN